MANSGDPKVASDAIAGTEPTNAASPSVVDEVAIPGYVVGEQLGTGGFGRVFRARHAVIGREVAIKVLHHRYSKNPEVLARFIAEARAVNQISHPGIVEIFDFGALADGRHFCIMELLSGRNLRQLLAERRLELAEAIPILRGIAESVEAAHAVGIAHRDLKPDNVFVCTDGRIKLIDFGLAKLTREEDAQVTQSGVVFGTPLYMSPEQCRGKGIDTRTDLYAFGALAYHVLVGEPPFAGDSLELVLHHLNDTAIAPSLRCPAVSPDVDDVLLALLAKDPNNRPLLSTAVAKLESVARAWHGGPPAATASTAASIGHATTSAIPRTTSILAATAVANSASSRPRRRWLVPLAMLAVVGVLAAGFVATRSRGAWLPDRDRRIAFVAVNLGPADDDWLTRTVSALAARRMRQLELRFRTVDTVAEADAVVTLSYRRNATDVSVRVVVEGNGRTVELGELHGSSIAGALRLALPIVGQTVGEGQAARGPDDAERAEMTQIGATSFEAYRLYTDIMDEWNGTIETDQVALSRRLAKLIELDPHWAHPYALRAHLDGMNVDQLMAFIGHTRTIVDRARDPGGLQILDAIEQTTPDGYARVAAILEPALERAPADVLLAYNLRLVYLVLNRTDDAIGLVRRLHERRPDLQFGADLADQLRASGRDGEISALMRSWLERSPDSEQALASQIFHEVDRPRFEPAIRYARALVFVHGDEPRRMRLLCDSLIASDQLREASAIADRMLHGTAYDRQLARFRIATIAIMEGRFSGAYETLKSLHEPGANVFGMEFAFVESQRDLARSLGLTEDALRFDAEVEKYHATNGADVAALRVRFDRLLAHGCTAVEPLVGSLPDGPGRAIARRLLLRAAAAKGCVPCAEVVQAGMAPVEDNLRSLFQFGVCAETEERSRSRPAHSSGSARSGSCRSASARPGAPRIPRSSAAITTRGCSSVRASLPRRRQSTRTSSHTGVAPIARSPRSTTPGPRSRDCSADIDREVG